MKKTDFEERGRENLNPEGLSLFELLVEDFQTHDRLPLEQGFWAVAVHRIGNWRNGLPRPLRAPLKPVIRGLERGVEWTCGITLPVTTRVGRRVRLWHHGSMILNASEIGDDVHIRHNTTFGVPRTHDDGYIPVIEDGADLGVGVTVLGAIRVGKNTRVGAHAVVLESVPDGATAVGIPARVVAMAETESEDKDDRSFARVLRWVDPGSP